MEAHELRHWAWAQENVATDGAGAAVNSSWFEKGR